MEELLKIKHELTKERDEKLSEIARVRVFDFIFSIQIFFRSFTCSVNFHEPANVQQKFQHKNRLYTVSYRVQFSNFAKTSTLSCFKKYEK